MPLLPNDHIDHDNTSIHCKQLWLLSQAFLEVGNVTIKLIVLEQCTVKNLSFCYISITFSAVLYYSHLSVPLCLLLKLKVRN